MLLYCRDGHVIAWYNEDHPNVRESEFGQGTTVVPWPSMETLSKQANGMYKAPVLAGKDHLIAYARFKHDRVLNGGTTAVLDGSPRSIPTDMKSLAHLQFLASTDPKATVDWVDADNQPVRLAALDLKTMTDAVATHISDTHASLSGIVAGINDGTVTTQDHIDNWSAP